MTNLDALEMAIYFIEVTLPDMIEKEGIGEDDFRVLRMKFREIEVKIGLVESLCYRALQA